MNLELREFANQIGDAPSERLDYWSLENAERLYWGDIVNYDDLYNAQQRAAASHEPSRTHLRWRWPGEREVHLQSKVPHLLPDSEILRLREVLVWAFDSHQEIPVAHAGKLELPVADLRRGGTIFAQVHLGGST